MTRPAAETDASRGSAARALSQRATSIADTRTRKTDPFASRTSVGSTLRYTRSRDPGTSPADAIAVAIDHDHLVALPRPGSGRKCLTVRDARRIAACHARYRNTGETTNAEACAALLREGLPEVLGVEWVQGP